jgi:hypothetical protein
MTVPEIISTRLINSNQFCVFQGAHGHHVGAQLPLALTVVITISHGVKVVAANDIEVQALRNQTTIRNLNNFPILINTI